MTEREIAESKEAYDYVNNHELTRPDTNIRKVLIYIATYMVSSLLLSLLLYHLSCKISLVQFPETTGHSNGNSHDFCITTLCTFIFTGIVYAKKGVIGLIKLYQHYASEETRRKCRFKPTCSEYAILAIRKYGLIIGFSKSFIRVVFRCRGCGYKIDYP